jgi:HAD superfamily hydrolase (TIGR01509 family)
VRPISSLIIFDCDGVLVDSETLENEVVAQCLTEAGFPMTGPQARERYIGLSMAKLMELVEAEMGQPLPESWLADFHARSRARLQVEIAAIEGVTEAIDAIEATGLETAVASSGEHAKMAITLGKTGLYERFRGRIFSAEEVAHGKPEPDVYLLAARKLGYDPQTCFAVEDSPNGVRAAVAAGMYVFGYAAQIDPARLTEAGAHEVFNNMSDLPTFVKWAMLP